MKPVDINELKGRVDQFHCLELPGQPMGMHMGTSYLVDDLWRAVRSLLAERDAALCGAQPAMARPSPEHDIGVTVWDAPPGQEIVSLGDCSLDIRRCDELLVRVPIHPGWIVKIGAEVKATGEGL
jgi:hypothetical protein